MTAPRHLWKLAQDRESEALRRWLLIYCRELLEVLGLRDGWWCGLFLPRHAIFGDGDQGDVDLLAGPIRYTMSQEDWDQLLRNKEREHGSDHAIHYAHEAASAEGLIEWPPTIEFVAACEVKASYFDGAVWKRTHRSSAGKREIVAQLDYLRGKGVNVVSFLHLAVTTPIDRGVDGVSADTRVLDLAGPTFPRVFDPSKRPGYGYIRSLIAAVTDGEEDMHGARQTDLQQPPSLVNALERRPWHTNLRARLAEVQAPTFLRTFIVQCPRCGQWRGRRDLWVKPNACGC